MNVRMTRAERTAFDRMAKKGMLIEDIRTSMRKAFGRCISQAAAHKRMKTIGVPYTGRLFSDEYRKYVIAVAREGSFPNAMQLRAALDPNFHDRVPSKQVILRWLSAAGVVLDGNGPGIGRSDFTRATYERAKQLLLDGYTTTATTAILAGEVLGRVPKRDTVERWSMQIQATLRRREAGVVLKVRRQRTVHSIEDADEDTPFMVKDWLDSEATTADLIRRDGCMLAKLRARRQARREAA